MKNVEDPTKGSSGIDLPRNMWYRLHTIRTKYNKQYVQVSIERICGIYLWWPSTNNSSHSIVGDCPILNQNNIDFKDIINLTNET